MPTIIAPSDLILMTEDQLGAALANLRQQIRNAKGADLTKLQKLRSDMNQRLDRFVTVNLRAIDKDPEIKEVLQQLNDLAVSAQKAVREMRDVTKAIKKGAEIVRYADDTFRILGTIAGAFP